MASADAMTTLERVQPYVEQLLEDAEVHGHLERAAANLRGARKRAKSPRKAVTDPKLRARVLRAMAEVVDAGVAIRQGPEKRARRSRRMWLAILVIGAAGAYLSYDEAARRRLMAAVGGDSE